MTTTTTDTGFLGSRRGTAQPARQGWSAMLWLLFLYFPIQAYLENPHPVWRSVVVSMLFLGFSAVFVVGFGIKPRYFATGTPSEHLVDAAWPVLVLVVLGFCIGALDTWEALPGSMIYVAVMASFRLPGRWAYAGMVLGVAVTAVVQAAVDPPAAEIVVYYLLIPLSSWGVMGTRTLIAKNLELERARDQVAALEVTAERERLARDVHDLLGHSLTVITVKAELANRLLDPALLDLDRARIELTEIEQLSRASLTDVRSTVGGLRTRDLAAELIGCQAALRAASIVTVVHGTPHDVPTHARPVAAWVLREAVTNVVRHSRADHCDIKFGRDFVTVSDNGIGVGSEHTGSPSTGLAGMRERVTAAGGTLTLDGHSGTTVEMRLP